MDWLVTAFFGCIFAVFFICTTLFIQLLVKVIEYLDILIKKENNNSHENEMEKIKQRIF